MIAGLVSCQVTHLTRQLRLDGILGEELKQPIRFQQREVEREIIIAQGQYQARPIGKGANGNTVYFCAESLPPQSRFSGGGGGSLLELLEWFGDRVNCPVINETKAPPGLALSWHDHLGSALDDIRSGSRTGVEKLQTVLDKLSEQTGLQFRHERRNVPIWKLVMEK
jgi:hypothetical protein